MNTIDTARIDTENAPGALESPWVFPGNVDTRLSYKTSNAGLLSWEPRMKILCPFFVWVECNELRMLGGPGLKYLEKLGCLLDLAWKSWIILMQVD